MLSKWAIRAHLLHAMSAEPESVFSEAKRPIGPYCHLLKQEAIEATECLKSWNKAQI